MNFYFMPIFYMTFLISSTILVTSSSSLFLIWLGLEINLMSFIPLISMMGEGKGNSESMIKYFLIQSISSSLILFMFLWSLLYSNSFLWEVKDMIMNISLSMKVGLAPFHFWFPEVVSGMNWMGNFILMTWQKISPLYILSLTFNSELIMVLGMLSGLMGAIMGLTQTSLQKILAFSSISHLGWIVSIISVNSNLWFLYLTIYIILTFINCLSFWFFNIKFMSQLYSQKSLWTKFSVFMNLLSTGGLPPLLGFGAKLVAFKSLFNYVPLMVILIMSSLITLYFYVRLGISSFTSSLYNMKSMESEKDKNGFLFSSFAFMFSFIGIFPVLFII